MTETFRLSTEDRNNCLRISRNVFRVEREKKMTDEVKTILDKWYYIT